MTNFLLLSLACSSVSVPNFHIHQFEKTDLDARRTHIESRGLTTELCASNECDNSYCWSFFTDDLKALAEGKKQSVTGLMNFFNADTAETTEPVSCKLHR